MKVTVWGSKCLGAKFTFVGRRYSLTSYAMRSKTRMSWITENRRIGAWAALFAFAIQLVLSFGHVHLDKLTVSSPAAANVQVASRDGGAPQPKHTGANDFCAICATIALVTSSVLPEAARLSPPLSVPSSRATEFLIARSAFDLHASFQARAPPAVG